MTELEKRFARKARQIRLACAVSIRANDIMGYLLEHAPECVVDLLFPLYWRIEDLTSRWFCEAYDGSLQEIEDAWEFADMDWLTPFQRLIANERILPLENR